MPVLTQGLTPVQERVLASNFARSGPFYYSLDLRPMLDCASPNERSSLTASPPTAHLPMSEPLRIAFGAKLRQEFFGGILFDCDHHRQYMVDQVGYHLLREIATGGATGRLTVEQISSPDAPAILQELVDAGVVEVGDRPAAVRHFPARDLSMAYLQSPIIVEVEVTYGCFRACRHCAYESSPDARRPDELTATQWGQIFEKLAAAGVLVIQLTGGDPLFRGDSFEIVRAVSDAGMSVYVRSDTAALSPANVRFLKELPGLWHVGTSMDGADAEMHDWMRGRGAFATLQKRIALLADAGIDVAVGGTLHKNNYATVRDMGRVATSLGASWFDIGFVSPVGRGVQLRHLVLNPAEVEVSLGEYLEGIRNGNYAPSHAHYLRRATSEQPFTDLAELARPDAVPDRMAVQPPAPGSHRLVVHRRQAQGFRFRWRLQPARQRRRARLGQQPEPAAAT